MIVETIKEIVIPLLQVVSVPTVAIVSSAKIAKLVKKNNELKEKIRLLTEIPLTLKNSVYYDSAGNAFCPGCRGNCPPLFVPLARFRSYEKTAEYICPKCKTSFEF